MRVMAGASVLGVGLALWGYGARADTLREESRVLNGCGGWAFSATHQTVISAHQAGPVGASACSDYHNQSGFLATVRMHPLLDTDGDGLPDEIDPDNDDDGLADATELGGHAFAPPTVSDPQVADGDGDGHRDGAEAAAGTNPNDADSVLRILSVKWIGDALDVAWASRDQRQYELLAAPNAVTLAQSPTVVATVPGVGGPGPWRQGVSTGHVAVTSTTHVYRVRVVSEPTP